MKQSCSTGEEDKLVHRSFETCFVVQEMHKHDIVDGSLYPKELFQKISESKRI